MKNLWVLIFLVMSILQAADNNQSKTPSQEENLTQQHLKEQMEREKKYAKEKTFYEGKEYNLSDKTIDPRDLNSIPVIKPEDDFDMNDVYSDEQ